MFDIFSLCNNVFESYLESITDIITDNNFAPLRLCEMSFWTNV
jgi:hypothetical protein